MKSMCRRIWLVAIAGFLGAISGLGSAYAASPSGRSANQERFRALLTRQSRGERPDAVRARPQASQQITDPYSLQGINAFNRRLIRQGRRIPAIAGPLDPGVASFRRDYILSLYRYRGLNHGGVAGGVYFAPPSGTPYYPVSSVNIFTYFPVYRAPF